MELLSWNSYIPSFLEHKGIWVQGLLLPEILKNCICNCMKPNNSNFCSRIFIVGENTVMVNSSHGWWGLLHILMDEITMTEQIKD